MHATTAHEIVPVTQYSPEEATTGQLPQLAEIDGKAINLDFPPFDKRHSWEPPSTQSGDNEHNIHASWSQLWKTKLPKGTQLRIARSPFSTDWCDRWFNSLQALEWDRPQVKGKALNRRTAWYVRGRCTCTYDYGAMQIKPRGFPAWLDDLMDIVMLQCGLLDKQGWPTSCNVNYYEQPGDMVGAHTDNENLFQGTKQQITIISLSLGGTREFLMYTAARQPLGSVLLRNGDMIAMEHWTQAHLKHGIAKLPLGSPEDPKRINLTWRWIAQHKLDCPEEEQRIISGPAALPIIDEALPADEAEQKWASKRG